MKIQSLLLAKTRNVDYVCDLNCRVWCREFYQ